MEARFSPRCLTVLCTLFLLAPALVAQNQNVIPLFGPVDTAVSPAADTYSNPVAFNSNTLSLNCTASPIQAILSGPAMLPGGTGPALSQSGALQPGGSVLVDNNILVTVTPANGSPQGPANVCVGGYNQGSTYNNLPVPPSLSQNCFSSGAYGSYATANLLNGDNPDTYVIPSVGQTVDFAGGVPPIDIGSSTQAAQNLLVPGQQSVTIALDDEGGWITSSSLFLTTNCTQGSVTGPAMVSGNPISTSDPSSLTQTLTFNTAADNQIGLVYDLSGAAPDLIPATVSTTPSPVGGDSGLDPAVFQADYVPGTSFATSKCFIHSGEALTLGGPSVCKLYSLECSTPGSNLPPSGAQCPVSTVSNEVIQDVFDGPAITLPNIPTPGGPTFHEGIGFLMASEDWTGGPCEFDPASGLENLPCPQNLLTSFSGPGGYTGTGQTTHPNSSFISIYGVPEDLTSVLVAGQWPDNWINSRRAKAQFVSQPPNLSRTKLPGAASFIPSPIQSITYGISAANSVPLPSQEPIATDTTLTNASANCSTPRTAKTAPNFVSPVQTLTFPADGQYLLHYYAQDCAGTQELQFTQAPGTGSWSTGFYTYPINVDTVSPVVANLALSPAGGTYKVKAVVNATYACTDQTSAATPGSGVVLCGLNIYAPGGTYNTGTLKTRVDTSSTGKKTFLVLTADGAGNLSSATISYTVTK